ncbi:hypothetical protein K0M31_011991 [Melipona bicolor]|uniref:Uncharacterized protein n=1 Tax=Melipona bicolor TaxID=60889 RepID=A0AA40KVJ2_9HYME|nr:hypothetical protein K0M31_011991 [Melipona bicolor]
MKTRYNVDTMFSRKSCSEKMLDVTVYRDPREIRHPYLFASCAGQQMQVETSVKIDATVAYADSTNYRSKIWDAVVKINLWLATVR